MQRHRPLAITSTIGLLACLTLTACGGTAADRSAGATRRNASAPPSTAQADPAAPGKSDLATKIKSEPDVRRLPPAFATCYANWLYTYIQPAMLTAYVQGKIDLGSIGGEHSLKNPKDPRLTTDMQACAAKAQPK
ncbi:hypothetical protein AB0L06_41980 [Spirillospora sp. NPDC052269]